MTTYQRVMIYFFNLDDYNVEIVYGDYGEDPPKWNDQAYRTITFLESPTGDLLTWLQANGVKQ